MPCAGRPAGNGRSPTAGSCRSSPSMMRSRLAGENEKALLVGLPVVHRHRVARAEDEEVDADLRVVVGRAAVTWPRGPQSRHSASRMLRTYQSSAMRGTLRPEPVEDDVEVAPPLAFRRAVVNAERTRSWTSPGVTSFRTAPARCARETILRAQLVELRRAGLLAAMDDACVQAGRGHHELADAADEVEERLAGIVGERSASSASARICATCRSTTANMRSSFVGNRRKTVPCPTPAR